MVICDHLAPKGTGWRTKALQWHELQVACYARTQSLIITEGGVPCSDIGSLLRVVLKTSGLEAGGTRYLRKVSSKEIALAYVRGQLTSQEYLQRILALDHSPEVDTSKYIPH